MTTRVMKKGGSRQHIIVAPAELDPEKAWCYALCGVAMYGCRVFDGVVTCKRCKPTPKSTPKPSTGQE